MTTTTESLTEQAARAARALHQSEVLIAHNSLDAGHALVAHFVAEQCGDTELAEKPQQFMDLRSSLYRMIHTRSQVLHQTGSEAFAQLLKSVLGADAALPGPLDLPTADGASLCRHVQAVEAVTTPEASGRSVAVVEVRNTAGGFNGVQAIEHTADGVLRRASSEQLEQALRSTNAR